MLDLGCQVIDLSADFRLKSPATYQEFYGNDHPAPDLLKKSVYGLPEIHRAQDQKRLAHRLAGVLSHQHFAAAHSRSCAPGWSKHSGIIADSLSGVSGAGRKLETDYLFVECNESARAYGVPRHRHLSEIEEQLGAAAGTPVVLQFTPASDPRQPRHPDNTILDSGGTFRRRERDGGAAAPDRRNVIRPPTKSEPFVRLLDAKSLPDTKNVTGTNVIEIAWRLDPRTGRLLVISALDNLTKGASGQAVQSMNILCGFPGNRRPC